FLEYRHCPRALWLKKRKPEAIEWPGPSDFDLMLMRDGYRVEAEVRKLVATWNDHAACAFQVEFRSGEALYARADMVRRLAPNQIDLFEIKSSASLYSATGQDHVDDTAFQ